MHRQVETWLDAFPHGTAALDRSGRVLYANEEFLTLTACSLRDLGSATVFDVLFDDAKAEEVSRNYRESRGVSLHPMSFMTRAVGGATVRITLASLRSEVEPVAIAVVERIYDHEDLRERLLEKEGTLREIARVKHAFSNSLMGLIGNLELLRDRVPGDTAVSARVDSLREEAGKMKALLAELGKLTVH